MTKYFPILVLFALIAFHLLLINKTFSQDHLGNFRAASAGYGDIPFHMTQVSKFAFQNRTDLNEPIYDGEKLRYPFDINLISGIILRYTNNWPLAMHLPAMGFMIAGITLTFFAYRSFLKSQTGAVVAIIIFLLGSGFGTNYLLKNYSQSSAKVTESFFEYLVDTTASTATKWDAVYPEQNIAWGAPLSLVFLHQRAFFLGFFMFSLFWYLLWCWIRNPASIKISIFLGLIVGLTPFSHYHSFIAMLVVLTIACFYEIIIRRKTELIAQFVFIGLIILVLAAPQILYFVEGKNNLTFSQAPFIQFRLGWMNQSTIGSIMFNPNSSSFFNRILSFVNFLWINFGVILPMLLISLIVSIKSKNFRERFGLISILSTSATVLFLLVQIIRFQPWDYDNNKILIYFQFFAAPVIVAFFIWISANWRKIGVVLLTAFTIITIHSGIVDQIPRFAVKTEDTPVIFNKDAVLLSDFIRSYISEDKKIITSSTHLNPVVSLAGRPVYVGYHGWLWTRGIDYVQREQSLRKFYADPLSISDNSYLRNAEYVLLDQTAVYDWEASKEKFDAQFTKIFSNNSYSLYKLRQQ